MKKGLKLGKKGENGDFYSSKKLKNKKEMFLFTYSLSNLKYKDKIRFFYALKGRGTSKGILKSTNTEQLGRTVLLTPKKNAPELNEFFRLWKCGFRMRKVWIE